MSTSKKSIVLEKSITQIKSISSAIQQSQLIFSLLFIGISLYFTAISNDAYLKWAEEFSVFIPTTYYFGDCMNFAGGLLAYAGTFLTQFFYFPLLGSLIFIAILLLIQYLTVIAFRIPKNYYPLSFIPSLMLLLTITQLGYVWMLLKSPGYFFSNSLGIVAFLFLFIAYRNLSNLLLRIAAFIIIVTGGYPLFGFYALFAGLICFIYEFILYVKDRKHSRLLPLLIGLTLIVFVPRLYYYFVYYHTQLCNIYIAGLPDFKHDLSELVLWLPFIILFISFPLLSYFLFPKQNEARVQKKTFFASSAAFLSAIIFLCVMSYSDANFTAGVRIYNAIERNDWNKVIEIARGLHGKPTKNIVLCYRMATLLTLQPTQNDSLLSRDNTIKLNCIRSTMPLKIQLGGISFYYNTGEINKCYRWCMENTVEFGMRVTYLKYMVKCAIVNEEYELARKYNAILLNSLFHKQWARRYQDLIENPQLTKKDGEMNLIRSMLEANEQEFEQL